MSLAVVFPGQGSQFVGMGADLVQRFAEARRTFEEADAELGFALSRLAFAGPAEELTATRNAQPAILVHSVAVLRVLGERLGPVGSTAGHSLGEFSAHVCAGTLSFVDALTAVHVRGSLMYEAGLARPGGMAAVLGLDDAALVAVCDEVSTPDSVVVPANFNSAGQVVVSGDRDAVERAMAPLQQAGAKRVVPLQVSGAFHSPLMVPAQEGLRRHLEGLDFHDPRVPVFSNVTAAPVQGGADARARLVEQLTAPVRWAESVAAQVAHGADRFLELGPGSVLTGLGRRNAKGVPARAVGTAAELEEFLREETG
ncbi:MAG: ACP S-malonyltransferase [Gemmatimonadota bacterium]